MSLLDAKLLRVLRVPEQPLDASIEIVERKGLGHPDTVADGLADVISSAYSTHCLREYGAVLHHNVDKLYFGGGHFTVNFGSYSRHAPIQIRTNGRMSKSFGSSPIDITEIQRAAVFGYLRSVLPFANLIDDFSFNPTSTQHTQRERWFSPLDRRDLPELNSLVANDTACVIGHAPYTPTEKLAVVLERAFWNVSSNPPSLSPRFNDVGQDVKIMIVREGRDLDVVACVPLLASKVSSIRRYNERISELEQYLQSAAISLLEPFDLTAKVRINPLDPIRVYMLAIGTAADCGEEGLVGRGNSIRGVISVTRKTSMEAPFGKNLFIIQGGFSASMLKNSRRRYTFTLVNCGASS